MYKYFANAFVVNEGKEGYANILVNGNRIEAIISEPLSDLPLGTEYIDCTGLTLIPGVIDCHVHFRQPGMEYKADMESESKAALAGGVTTVLEMPNTNPTTTSIEELENKNALAQENMYCNYGFFLGLTNSNSEIAKNISRDLCCGLKLFLGSSTGNMLVDNKSSLDELFSITDKVISAHCEDEAIIKENLSKYKSEYGDNGTAILHPKIRTSEACYKSSAFAVQMAEKNSTRLHIAHISTKKEISLLKSGKIESKNITAEVSPIHLWFCSDDFEQYGNLIKCNPSIKTKEDREALREALRTDKIDIIATDHAPHTKEEKQKPYFEAPSGIPSIQHSLLIMLQLVKQNVLSLPQLVEKMSHNPAILFDIKERGFLKKGYFADFVLINSKEKTTITKENLHSKCNWSPFEGETFDSKIVATYLNGEKVYENGVIQPQKAALKV